MSCNYLFVVIFIDIVMVMVVVVVVVVLLLQLMMFFSVQVFGTFLATTVAGQVVKVSVIAGGRFVVVVCAIR